MNNSEGLAPGPLDDRFLIEHPVGEGATGVVYRAFDLDNKRPVALKVFHPDQQGFEGRALRAAQGEFSLVGNVVHPGIVEVLEAGRSQSKKRAYLVMEWIEGHELSAHHQSAPLSARNVIALGVLLCRALQSIHSVGITHGDLKPSNIMLRRRAPGDALVPELEVEPVLIDFGLATEQAAALFAGTPAYMSPEQAKGESDIDSRSDLYSLGATLYELLIGRPPHQGASPLATLARLATTPAPRMSVYRTDLPRAMDDLVYALLQTDRQQRPANAEIVEARLMACLEEDEPWSEGEPSSRLGAMTTRLVTTIVAMNLHGKGAQAAALTLLRQSGAEAVPLGVDAIVAHLGASRATGGEARAAVQLGISLAVAGAAVGVASGRARVTEAHSGEPRPMGEVVDRAATLARESKPKEVLADATTSELGRGRFEFRIRRDGSAIVGSPLKRVGELSGGAPFVGRETELAQLLSAFDRCQNEKRSMVLSVSGPPGIGKSRLQRECVARLSTKPEAPLIVVQRSDAYGSHHVLGAASDILRSLLNLERGANSQEVERAIVDRLGPETMNELSRENRGLLGDLLKGTPLSDEYDPGRARDALWLAMTDIVLRILSDEPVVLVTEDLQWADTESIAWIDHLLGRSSRHALFVLSCVRPSFWRADEERYKNRDHLRIDLRPISHQSVRIIAETVLGERSTPQRLDSISAQAAGSPLFAEELSRLAVTGKGGQSAPTIEAAIQASLDSLDPLSLDALQRLSVLGQSCWDRALTAFGISNAPEVMRTLVAQDVLIRQSNSRYAACEEYNFKHALVRDVAYASLEESHKGKLHALAGHWLSAQEEDAATVAEQLDLGGEPLIAANYWEKAAQRALAAHALKDAMSMAERALDFSENTKERFRRASYLDEAHARLDPRAADRETAVHALEINAFDEASLVHARGARARYDDARGIGEGINQRLIEVLEAATILKLTDEVARCSATLASRAAFAGDFELAEKEVQRLLALSAEKVHSAPVDAYQTLAIIHQAKGAVSSSLHARKDAIKAARQAGLREREAMLTTNLGFALSTIGARKEARDALERGLSLAEQIGSPGATRHAQMNLLGWAGLYGTDRSLDTFLSETRADADASATGFWTSSDRANLGILYYRGVELLRSSTDVARTRALALLKLSAESYRQLNHRDVLPVALGMWAEAERLCQHPHEAAKLGEEAAQLIVQGAPSLLNETPVFLTLYKARLELGDDKGALSALASSIRPLLRRLTGLVGSPYATTFLTQLPQNAELVAAAEAAGILPESIHRILDSAGQG